MQLETHRSERERKSALLRLDVEVSEAVNRVKSELHRHPEAMGPFFDLLQKGVKGLNLPERRVHVGTMCNLVPEELILALDAVPVRLCSGSRAFEQMGGDYLPARCCPLVKATVGKLCALQEVSGFKLDLIVVPTTCDQRRKAVDHLREMGWRVYPLEVPPVKSSEEAQYYWRNSIKNLCLALEKLTGRRLTRKGLRESIDTLNQSRREYRRLTDRMSSSPSAIPGTDVMLVAHTRFFQEPHRWARAVAALNQELESRTGEVLPSRKVHPPRILLTGSPPIFPNIKLPLLIETSGALLVADEVCSSFRLLHDTVSYDEENLYDMIPALADRYLKPSTCPFQVDNSDRIRRLLDLAERSGVHGVVYQSFSGCSPYEMEQRTVAHALRERSVPMLGIETDYSHEDMGQLTTRIEAFVESIRIRKQEV